MPDNRTKNARKIKTKYHQFVKGNLYHLSTKEVVSHERGGRETCEETANTELPRG